MLSFAWLPHDVCVCSFEIADEGKMGLGFTSADDLEAIDIGPGDKSRPTFISKKLGSELKDPFVCLLKEYVDCFAWEYHEMPGLSKSIVEH